MEIAASAGMVGVGRGLFTRVEAWWIFGASLTSVIRSSE